MIVFEYRILSKHMQLKIECVEIMDITQKDSIISFVYTIGGSAIAILLYYLVLQRLFIGEKTKRIAVTQYWIYALISIYVLLNVGEILFLMKYELSGKDYLFLLLVAIFIIIINLYLFHLLDTFSENRDLKYKLALYERQAKHLNCAIGLVLFMKVK